MNRSVLPVLAASCLLLVACRKLTVESYRVPKDAEPPAPKTANAAPMMQGAGVPPASAPAPAGSPGGQSAMANTTVPTAGGPGLTWTAPAGWASKQGAAMRKATYVLKVEGLGEAELAITAFPGDVGGELANVNRWRGQISLPPISQADLGSAVTRLERNGLQMAVVDISSPDGAQRLLGAMVPNAGATWFFKLGAAPSALIEKGKPEFMAFLETIKPAP